MQTPFARARRAPTSLLSALAFCSLAGCNDKPPPPPPPPDAGAALECPGSGVSKGPWALRADRASAVVRWETCKPGVPGDLSFEPEAGGAASIAKSTETESVVTETRKAPLDPLAPPDQAGTYYMHEAKLEGLTAGTCYRYKLAADDKRGGRVCTGRTKGEPIRFLAIADTNPGLNGITTKLINKIVLPSKADFMIHAGDIQYYDSGLETWASWAPLMQPFLSAGALFPAVGNHENEKPEEIEAYFARYFGDAGFDGTKAYFRFESGGVWFFALDTEQDYGIGSDQGVWLLKQLADAAAKPDYRFSVLYFHSPWVTCGDKAQDTPARMAYEPMFLQYGVKLVIQGHMHGYERFELGDFTYLTTGGGGGALDDVNKNLTRPECASRVASGAFRHAIVFDIGASSLKAVVTDDSGAVRDQFEKAVP